MKLEEIRIRDPFILADESLGWYYLYGTTNVENQQRFCGYRSKDLENFEFTKILFKQNKDFWADRDFWAPEVHYYKGRYYMFASFKSQSRTRCTQVLVSDSPDGDFIPYSQPLTPTDWECLDGTLFVENGVPYMIFCKEWLQTIDGEMYIVELSDDLKTTVGQPKFLFKASSSGWSKGFFKDNKHCYVTDGPFIVKGTNNYIMIWSSGSNGVYQMGQAVSTSLLGPWRHIESPIITQDGGHGMIFKTFEGKNKLCIHQPNNSPFERTKMFDIKIEDIIELL